MLTLSKKGEIGKVVVWIIILLVIIGIIYMVYNYVSKSNSDGNNQYGDDNSGTEDGINADTNIPNYDVDKPPLPPE